MKKKIIKARHWAHTRLSRVTLNQIKIFFFYSGKKIINYYSEKYIGPFSCPDIKPFYCYKDWDM